MNKLKEDIIQYMNTKTRFSLDDDDDNVLLYSTRENGDMEHDRAGEEDILRARQIREALYKVFPVKSIRIDTCDEWTFLHIEV